MPVASFNSSSTSCEPGLPWSGTNAAYCLVRLASCSIAVPECKRSSSRSKQSFQYDSLRNQAEKCGHQEAERRCRIVCLSNLHVELLERDIPSFSIGQADLESLLPGGMYSGHFPLCL